MKAEDIIRALNLTLREEQNKEGITSNGVFVIQRNIEINPQFKIYKTYSASLWYVIKKKKHLVFETKITNRVSADNDVNMVEEININLIRGVLSLYKSDNWEEIKKGEYGVFSIE